jgi:hypothetical protein
MVINQAGPVVAEAPLKAPEAFVDVQSEEEEVVTGALEAAAREQEAVTGIPVLQYLYQRLSLPLGTAM